MRIRTLLLLWLTAALHAQSGDPWSGLRAKNPAGVSVPLRLVNPHVFRQGELLLAQWMLPGRAAVAAAPPAERWQFGGILVDPPVECGTISKPCLFRQPGGGGGGDIDASGLRGGSEGRPAPLNTFVPELAPGRYRVAVLARKLVLRGSVTYGYPDPPEYAVSNAVELEVVAATADWVRDTIAKSAATLRSSADYQAQEDAAGQLAFLNDPAAWRASLDLLPKEEGVLLAGLGRGRPASRVCELMLARVSAPAQSVSWPYINRLTEICANANLPPAPAVTLVPHLSATPPPANTAVAPPNPELVAWGEKWRVYTQTVRQKATAALARSLAAKQPQVQWDAFATLLQHIAQVRANRPPEPDPAGIPLVSREFVRAFPTVEVARKRYFLDLYVSAIDSPQVAPLLESVLDGWKPGDYYEAAHSAIRELHRIDPARAQARILAELVKEKTWLDAASLELLPASAVVPMDDALIESLARAQRPGGWNSQLSMAAIARYATPRALPRIRAIYESQQVRCQPELMAYFVRVDPAYADRVFRSSAWDMHAEPPACTVQYFTRTPPLAMSAGLEQYIAAYLMHGNVFVKSTAARTLGRYGTGASLAPLWEAFRYFHDYWNGKAAELAANGEGAALEVDLRNAIARGRGWLATAADLDRIEALCISGRCIQETRQDRAVLDPPLRIELMAQPSGGLMGTVAQYYGLDGVDAVEGKLAQYPRGTRFQLYAPRGSIAKMADEIRRFATEKGLIVTPR